MEIRGTHVAAPLTTGDSAAKFGTHYSFLGIGGYMEVMTVAERDAIDVDEVYGRMNDDGRSSGRRRIDMLVHVHGDKTYQLDVTGFETMTTDEQKYLGLRDNLSWKPYFNQTVPLTGVLRIHVGTLYGSADSTFETMFAFDDFDFAGKSSDNIFLLDTNAMQPNLDANSTSNRTPDVRIRILDSVNGGVLGVANIMKRVNGVLVHLEIGDLQREIYLLIPPADRTIVSNIYSNPYELVKWNWQAPGDKNYLLDVPVSDSIQTTLTITGATHGLGKIPSVTLLDVNHDERSAGVNINPITFDVVITTTQPFFGKVVLN
jgi:hypothetical protein